MRIVEDFLNWVADIENERLPIYIPLKASVIVFGIGFGLIMYYIVLWIRVFFYVAH